MSRLVLASMRGWAEKGCLLFSSPFTVDSPIVRSESASIRWGVEDSKRASRRRPQNTTFVFATSRSFNRKMLDSIPPATGVPKAPTSGGYESNDCTY